MSIYTNLPNCESKAQDEPNLEMLFIKEYLREKSFTLEDVRNLPKLEARQLMTEASAYASAKLAEMETQARLIKEIHDAYGSVLS